LDSFVDEQRKTVVFVSNDVLLKSLQRDSPAIAQHFDTTFEPELKLFNEEFCKIVAILFRATRLDDSIQPPELRNAMLFLLWNATQSLVAAIELLRRGFTLQPGILIRALIEQLTTVCHLGLHRDALKALQSGKLSSTDTLGAAKKIIPMFGHLYGLFSNTFAHVSHLHLSLNLVAPYKRDDRALLANLTFIRFALWTTYVVTELACFPHVAQPRYWKRGAQTPEGTQYPFEPSEAEQRWMRTFLSQDLVGQQVHGTGNT
jgi:hypothetical protein